MVSAAPLEVNRVPEVFQSQSEELTGASMSDAHAHCWAQISVPMSHAVTVMATGRALVVAPMTAVWMPAGVMHQAYVEQTVHVCNLFVNPSLVAAAPSTACTFEMTPFVYELLLHMLAIGKTRQQSAHGQKLLEILLETVVPAPLEAVSMRMPRDRRLRAIARSVLVNPADQRSLEDWSRLVGASYRTLARHFISETGLTFQEWKQTVCIIQSMKMLSTGTSVCNVAAEFGYASVSGFTTMFKRATGYSPSEYARMHHAGASSFDYSRLSQLIPC